MPSETKGNMILGLTPTFKAGLVYREACWLQTHLKTMLRGNYTTLGWEEENIRRRQLAQDADLICMIIYNVFLIPWTYSLSIKCFLSCTWFYASLKLNPIVGLWPIICVQYFWATLVDFCFLGLWLDTP